MTYLRSIIQRIRDLLEPGSFDHNGTPYWGGGHRFGR